MKARVFDNMCFGSTNDDMIVFSDTDVAFFPGWWPQLLNCLSIADLCIGQQPGLAIANDKSVNIGFMGVRCSVGIRKFFATYLAALLRTARGGGRARLDQRVFDVMLRASDLRWAVLSPYVLGTSFPRPQAPFLHRWQPNQPSFGVMHLKIWHATASGAGFRNKLVALTSVRRKARWMSVVCPPGEGPLHPVCEHFGCLIVPVQSFQLQKSFSMSDVEPQRNSTRWALAYVKRKYASDAIYRGIFDEGMYTERPPPVDFDHTRLDAYFGNEWQLADERVAALERAAIAQPPVVRSDRG